MLVFEIINYIDSGSMAGMTKVNRRFFMKQEQLVTMGFMLVVAGVAFFGGMKYQQSKQPSFAQFEGRMGGARQGVGGQINQGNRAVGFRPITGSILSIDNGTMTVKLEDGSSKIVALPDSATIDKSAPAVKADLTVGTTVMVMGTTNTDGSVTAQTIQLNPVSRSVPTALPQK
jgi:hypothetical protein